MQPATGPMPAAWRDARCWFEPGTYWACLISLSPLQKYSFDAPNELITAYPLVLVPVFGVVARRARLARRPSVTKNIGAQTLSPEFLYFNIEKRTR